MRIGVIVSTTGSHQLSTLIQSIDKAGHESFLWQPSIDIVNIKELEDLELFKCDVIYWRGSDFGNTVRTVFAKIAHNKNIPFIDFGYKENGFLGNKLMQLFLVKDHLKVAKTLVCKEKTIEEFNELTEILGEQFIVKPQDGAKGFGVELIKSFKDFEEYFKEFKPSHSLAQEYLKERRDYRVIVINHKAVGTMERIPKKGDIRANISQGGHGVHIVDEDKNRILFEIAEKATKILNIQIAGIDIFEVDGEFYFNEANNAPQWVGFERVTGISVSGKIVEYFESLVR